MKSRLFYSDLFLSVLFVITLSLVGSTQALAMDLQQAKEAGIAGETPSGYLAIVNDAAPAEAKTLVADINEKRKSKYHEIAKRNGTSVSSVEKLAGEQAISRTPSGQYVMTSSGEWVRK